MSERISQPRASLALLALALGAFGIGLTEFAIVGLLPQIATDFAVTEPTAGFLVSGYALSVALGAIGITIAVVKLDRKRVLMALLLLFIIGNLMSGFAANFAMTFAGRVVAALCHGAFFGIGAVLAVDVAGPTRKAFAISVMFGGLTVANVFGVPLGTLLGQHFGWRSTFLVISGVGVLALAAIFALVPRVVQTADGRKAPAVRTELFALRNLQVVLSLAVTILGFGGMFGAFTYIAFTLTRVSGFGEDALPLLLVVFGVGVVLGNMFGGRAADRNANRTLVWLLVILAAVLALFALTAENKVLAVVCLAVMGGVGFALAPGFQSRVLQYAAGAPTIASGANIAAFNLGNALGAWLGGVTITAGLGFTAPLWMAVAMTLGALILLLLAIAIGSTAQRKAALGNTGAGSAIAGSTITSSAETL